MCKFYLSNSAAANGIACFASGKKSHWEIFAGGLTFKCESPEDEQTHEDEDQREERRMEGRDTKELERERAEHGEIKLDVEWRRNRRSKEGERIKMKNRKEGWSTRTRDMEWASKDKGERKAAEKEEDKDIGRGMREKRR